MRGWLRIPLQLATLALIGLVALVAVVTGAYYYVEPGLPTAEELQDITSRFKTPMSVYSRDHRLMQRFGEQERIPADIEEIPLIMRQAILAAEDDAFYEHSGIDYVSTLRAVLNYGISFVTGDDRVPGGSTITQQITRTTDLMSRDYGLARKIPEIFLAFRIEREFEKDEILEIYLNTYFFGQNSYGVVTAARTYFNKDLSELTLSDAAIIAGIPTRPSYNNPYDGPEAAAGRRNYVLNRMLEVGYITREQRDQARNVPIISQKFDRALELEAGYVADFAYRQCLAMFTERVCEEEGLTIVTTIDSELQRAANEALRAALEGYDRNHGYRGPIGSIDLAAIGIVSGDDTTNPDAGAADSNADATDRLADAADQSPVDLESSPTEVLTTLLGDYPARYGAEAAVVLDVTDLYADVYFRSIGRVSIGFDAVSWAREYINDDRQGSSPQVVGDVLSPGDIVRFRRTAEGAFTLAQVPEADDATNGERSFVQGALVSVDPFDGAVVALTGGYDFGLSQFNRASQATAARQPGSAFKPFLYLSALAAGYTLADIINDVQRCRYEPALEQQHCVSNYNGRDYGPTRLREVLIESLNASADRVIENLGATYVANYVERFGFDIPRAERNASLALGASVVTPLELASAYSVLANGGFAVGVPDPDDPASVDPYIIQTIYDAEGRVLYDADWSVRHLCARRESDAGADHLARELIEQPSDLLRELGCAERVESAQRIYLITDVLDEVIQRGSGTRARNAFPGRTDLRGKTGTTNGPTDAWFAGFNTEIVAVARIGFDRFTRDLGNNEQGGRTAIPAWIDYMRVALEYMPVSRSEPGRYILPQPLGIVEARINRETGELAAYCNPDTEDELFLRDNLPPRESETACTSSSGSDPLFE